MSFNRVIGAMAVGALLVGCSTTLSSDRSPSTPSQLAQQRLYSLLNEKPCPVTCGCSAEGSFVGSVGTDQNVSLSITAQEIPTTDTVNATGEFAFTDPSGTVFTGTINTITCGLSMGIPFVEVLGTTATNQPFRLTYFFDSEVSSLPDSFSIAVGTATYAGTVTSGGLVRREGEPCNPPV